jgi:hypothetical protein
MGGAAFLAFIRAQGLTPPADYPGGEDDLAWAWGEWWEEHILAWDKGLVERLWDVLDGLRFYEVVEVPWDNSRPRKEPSFLLRGRGRTLLWTLQSRDGL